MNLKKQLRHYMDHYDYSASRLSKKSGVSKQVISLWLSGGSPRKIEQVKRMADVFETSIDHLCFGDGFESKEGRSFDELETGEWLSGVFELKIRKIK